MHFLTIFEVLRHWHSSKYMYFLFIFLWLGAVFVVLSFQYATCVSDWISEAHIYPLFCPKPQYSPKNVPLEPECICLFFPFSDCWLCPWCWILPLHQKTYPNPTWHMRWRSEKEIQWETVFLAFSAVGFCFGDNRLSDKWPFSPIGLMGLSEQGAARFPPTALVLFASSGSHIQYVVQRRNVVTLRKHQAPFRYSLVPLKMMHRYSQVLWWKYWKLTTCSA